VNAKFTEGVIEVHTPRLESSKPRTVKITKA
jgi:hypothetical protein